MARNLLLRFDLVDCSHFLDVTLVIALQNRITKKIILHNIRLIAKCMVIDLKILVQLQNFNSIKI